MATPIQALTFYLATAIDATQTSIPVRGLKDSRGNLIIAMPSGATIIFATLEPRSSANQEIISFTGITNNGNGLVTLTGVTRNLNPQPPFTAMAGVVTHGNNAEVILSNSPAFYNTYTQTDQVATITVQWQFPAPTSANSPATKAYVDAIAIAGAPDAGTATKGVTKLTTAPLTTLGVNTVTIASPAVVSLTAHGLIAGDTVRFTTTGALPTGLAVATDYYVIATGLTANAFQLSTAPAGTAINTSGSQSGVHTLYRTTPFAVGNDDPRLPTQLENDAMVGKSGSQVGTSNKFLDEAMINGGSLTDQSQVVQNTAIAVGEADATTKKRRIEQSFIAGKTPILGVKLWKKTNTGTFTGNVVVSIQADSAGNPSGTDLVAITISNATYLALANNAEFTAQFASSLLLNLGTTYWVVIAPSTGDNSNCINLGYQNTNVYASGVLKAYNVTDGHSLVTGDLYFSTFIDPANKIATVDTSNKLGAYDGSNLTGITKGKEAYVASGAIAQNDSVYPVSATQMKTIYPSAVQAPTTITTSPTSSRASKSLPLSTSGQFLHIVGGTTQLSGALVAQVRTINAGETDFSNGTEAIIYNTSNGVRGYDVVSIGTDKFMFIFQADTGGAGAGIKIVVVTVSGTTVTVGSITTLETTGNLSAQYSVAKLNTDKCVVIYAKDSDTDIYAQVITVSGTAITTNTAYLIKAISGTLFSCADQLSANDSAIVIYSNPSDGTNVYGRTLSISGTVVTVNAENTLKTVGGAGGVWKMAVRYVSATQALFVLGENSAPTNDLIHNIAISGTTLTLSTGMTWITQHVTEYYGIYVISPKYALVAGYTTNTGYSIYFVDISASTPVAIGSPQNVGFGTTSNQYQGLAIVKVSPWTYVCDAYSTDADYLFKLTPVSTARVGMAESAIADTASGNILYRYQPQTLAGITLTSASTYYVDDNGQPTTKSSVTALTLGALGIAISTTKILQQ